ncbi:N-acetyltransferase [Microbacterium oleivorans]|uniref:Putative acetyltransferase GNAT family protein n=1 Tax=Microbacterium oleivorans TaxID=273677 RepID=A0A031FTZ3_9MICO|nr:GNAT family N-acetyltransferase [Microbacterium oleivorans]AZS45269.1 hypothetical protein BWL13_02868 [Microbacterium oleivorans]EZP27747.1 putative acetyltransferase GNAT family protein [Microbacterium oleivorans]THE06832.1 N-acetyltransferase [Microbacterium oleivorans]
MTVADPSWAHPEPATSGIRLDLVPGEVLHALARGETDAITSPYLAGPVCASLWRRRSEQILATPADHLWVTRLIVDPDVVMPVGVAGFHGAPDETGMVEVGYRVDPVWRRRGYARGALEILIFEAQQHPDVKTVRATISPDNVPSISLVTAYGFVVNGEQWDDEDGLEIIYERDAA